MTTARRFAFALGSIAGLALLSAAGVFAWRNLRGIGPAVEPPPQDIAQLISKNGTDLPLTLPPGLSVSVFAKNLPGARVLAFDADNAIYVSETSAGNVIAISQKDGVESGRRIVASGLTRPHGLAFDPHDRTQLYIAEETRIVRLNVADPKSTPQKVIDLPKGGRHFTRTLGFGPDDKLYVSIGSTCDVCREPDERHASIWSLNRDGSNFTQVAKGLRNSVFFAWDYLSGGMWATEMGRDLLGDTTPPDEINLIEPGKNYGWPNCYGNNVHDAAFDKNVYIRNPCLSPFETPPLVELPAHVAPLGIAFVPEEGWPEEWANDAIVAEHGSWNSSAPVGYKLVRVDRDAKGNVKGVEDFVTGWLTGKGALGRPVDVLVRPGGTMYVSDDKAGVIYLFRYGLTK